jgi:hypothetical protein
MEAAERVTKNGASWPSIDQVRRSRADLGSSECALIGILLLWPARLAEVSEQIGPEDIQDGHMSAVYSAMLAVWKRGSEPHVPLVDAELKTSGAYDRVSGLHRTILVTLLADAPVPGALDGLVRIVLDRSMRRRLELTGRTIVSLAADLELEGEAVLDQAKELVANVDSGLLLGSETEPLGVFCQGDDTFDWLVPGLIERGDRTLLVAGESAGKSMMLRQVAVTCSFGIHPFNGKPVDPMRVLMVDLENPPTMGRRKLRRARQFRPQGDDAMMSIVCRPAGIDLTKRTDSRWLASQVMEAKPDLVVCGPLYKMFSPDDRYESGASKVAMILDDLRTRMNFALIMETHAPQEYGGGKREMRPIGSSLWRRWPEFGLAFVPVDGHPDVVRVNVWKPRDERQWPRFLRRGGDWPWTPCADPEGPKGRPEPQQSGLRPGFGEDQF